MDIILFHLLTSQFIFLTEAESVFQRCKFQALMGFLGDNQYLELHLEMVTE